MSKIFKVKASFCELPVGTTLNNVPTEYQSELVEQGFIEEVKSDKKTKEKTEE